MKYSIFRKLWNSRKFFLVLFLTVAIVTTWKQEAFNFSQLLHNLYILTLSFFGFEVVEYFFDKLRLKYDWNNRYPIVNWIFNTRIKIGHFFSFTLNYRYSFLLNLNRKLGKWELCGNGPDFYLQLAFTHPMLVGDEMFINDPIVPLNDPSDVRYGYYYQASYWDLPRNPLALYKLWQKAVSTYRALPVTDSYRTYCDHCAEKGHEYSASGIKHSGICPKCFGLATVYHWGKQTEYGQKFMAGSTLIWTKNGYLEKIIFTPEGLKNLLILYDRFTSGIVADIAQHHLIKHAYSIICATFPNAVIYITYDKQSEPGLCDFVWGGDNETWYRHFYLLQEDKYINLYTGNIETLNQETLLVTSQDHLPNRDRWNVTLDILRNLCKYAK